MTIVYCAAFVPLIWAAATDVMKRTIPVLPVILLAILGVVKIAILGLPGLMPAITGLLCIGLPMLLLSCFIQHGSGIGGGDVKLCAALGFLLGAINTLLLLIFALTLLLFYAKLKGKKEQPFAPFALLGYAAILTLILLYGG